MKKIIIILISSVLILCGCSGNTSNALINTTVPTTKQSESCEEMRAVWIPYFELDFADKSENGFDKSIGEMFKSISDMGMNTVFVHVRAYSDAFYKSKYFPYSKQAAGKQGTAPAYDPLEKMIKSAHGYGLKIHAWINPFRVSKTTDLTELSDDNPAKIYLTDDDKSNDSWVKTAAGGLYYNPAVPQVQSLVINGVREIAENYDVDGIHIDDYFYPTTDDTFDKDEYDVYAAKAGAGAMLLADFRRTNVDMLVSGIYRCVKTVKPDLAFGISPQANMDTNYNSLYANIKKWVSSDGYTDYIMPQIYFGFEYPDLTGSEQSFKFDECAKYWSEMVKGSSTKLYIGLGIYKSGEQEKIGELTSGEWVDNTDIIARQVKCCRNISNCGGFAIYSLGNMSGNENREKELHNLTELLKISD